MSHPTGRRLFVLDDCDARVMGWAADHDGLLPDWATPYTLDALVLEGYATPAGPDGPGTLTEAGRARWARVVESHRAFLSAERTFYDAPPEDR